MYIWLLNVLVNHEVFLIVKAVYNILRSVYCFFIEVSPCIFKHVLPSSAIICVCVLACVRVCVHVCLRKCLRECMYAKHMFWISVGILYTGILETPN